MRANSGVKVQSWVSEEESGLSDGELMMSVFWRPSDTSDSRVPSEMYARRISKTVILGAL